MDKKMNIGVIGLGFMGKKHIECYLKMDNVNLAAVADVNIESIKKEIDYKFGIYKTIEEMLESETLDAVDVCLPTIFHKEAVVKALNYGVNVIVEKPFALQTADIDEMIECSIKNNKRLMVAHVCRFTAEYIFAKKILDSNDLGKPLFYYSCRNSATPKWSVNNWLADKKFSGGTVMDLQIHDIDIANWLLGEAVDYKMVEVNNPLLGTANFGHVVSTIKYRNNSVAVLEAGHLMPQVYPFTTTFRLVCEKGVLEFSKGYNSYISFVMYKDNEIIDMTDEYKLKHSEDDPYLAELVHFVECVINNKEFAITTTEARNAVNTVNMLKENVY